MEPDRGRVTVPKLATMKGTGQKISMVTAYDYPLGLLVDQAGVDAVLVGDSLGMVIQGHETTLPVTLEEMIYHATMVTRAVRRALVVVDLPFPTYHLGTSRAVENAAEVLKKTGCQAVKLESGADQAEVISAMVRAGIPVMAHCGLRPQSVHQLGGYGVQRDRERLMNDARAAAQAGAFSIVLECIPADIAAEITAASPIPTIGIGAGPYCDGQVLVLHDLLGLTSGRVPRHVKKYAALREAVLEAIERYREEVRQGVFPSSEQTST
jgi:3-methyl-2-oxobutanoate hydroxymethyltransferase